MSSRSLAWKHLIENYHQPSSPVGYASSASIYKYYNGLIPLKKIKSFLSTQNAHTLHRQYKKPRVYNPIYTFAPRQQLHMDIGGFHHQSKSNFNHPYFLLIIDTFTKRIFLRPLKSKNAPTVKAAFQDMYDKEIGRAKVLVTDLGKVSRFCLMLKQSNYLFLFYFILFFTGVYQHAI